MREYNVHEVLSILKKYYITDAVDAQMVTRWIRDRKLHGERGSNRKEGYRVTEDDLFEFIEEQRPGLPAIMKVYEDFIDSLNPEENVKEAQTDIVEHFENTEPGEMPTKIKIKQLQEQVNLLETQVLELEDEKQRMSESVIEIQQQNNSLFEQNKLLKEERNQYVQLNTYLNKEIEQLKKLKSDSYVDKESIERSVTPIPKKEFLDIGRNIVAEMNLKNIDKDVQNHHLIQIYGKIYDEDGNLRKECVKDERFKCPISGKSYKQQKRLVTTAIKTYLETNRTEIENGSKEKTMMNT